MSLLIVQINVSNQNRSNVTEGDGADGRKEQCESDMSCLDMSEAEEKVAPIFILSFFVLRSWSQGLQRVQGTFVIPTAITIQGQFHLTMTCMREI